MAIITSGAGARQFFLQQPLQLAPLPSLSCVTASLGAAARREPGFPRASRDPCRRQIGDQRQRLCRRPPRVDSRSIEPPVTTAPAARPESVAMRGSRPTRQRDGHGQHGGRDARLTRQSARAATSSVEPSPRRAARRPPPRARAPRNDPRTAATAPARRRRRPPTSSPRSSSQLRAGSASHAARCGADDSGARAFREVDELVGCQMAITRPRRRAASSGCRARERSSP